MNVFARDISNLRAYKQIQLQKSLLLKRKKTQFQSHHRIDHEGLDTSFCQTDLSFIRSATVD